MDLGLTFWYSVDMPEIADTQNMPPREKEIRHALAQLVAEAILVRGTLSERAKVCGKPSCRCARGERHQAFYLVASQKGKLKQLSIPKGIKRKVEDWADTYREILRLLDELSTLQWERIKKRDL